MTLDDHRSAVMEFTEDEAELVAAAAVRHPVTGENPFGDKDSQAAARDTITASWPEFGEFAARVAKQVRTPPYFLLVHNVPLSNPEVFFVALAVSVGEPVDPYRQSWSRMIHRILPRKDKRSNSNEVLNEHLHTDGTDWPRPNDLTCLLCHQPDQNGGGRSRLLPVHLLRDHLRAEDERLLALLTETPVPWLIAESLGGGVQQAPILAGDRVRWLKYTVDSAVAEGAELDAEVASALARFQQHVDCCPAALEFSLCPGDLLLVNNTRCMHARTPVPDPVNSQRSISRIKVMFPADAGGRA